MKKIILALLTVTFGMTLSFGQGYLVYIPDVDLTYEVEILDNSDPTEVVLEDGMMYSGEVTWSLTTSAMYKDVKIKGKYLGSTPSGFGSVISCDPEIDVVCFTVHVPDEKQEPNEEMINPNWTGVSVFLNDGTHRRIEADNAEFVNGVLVLSGNTSVSIDATYGSEFDNWNAGDMKAWPPFADGKDHDLLLKGDVTTVVEVGEGGAQYYVECFPSQNACHTIHGYGL